MVNIQSVIIDLVIENTFFHPHRFLKKQPDYIAKPCIKQ